MPDNPQEQTEAKLLAFIDGELDDVGRAEIERHLQANPKRRRLLDELSAGRRRVRMLPREVAPPDLFENVQAQLERQELLSRTADVNPDTGNFRLTRWGQIRAAAAVLLLATGLGVMIYNVLPKKGGGSAVAINGESPVTPTTPGGAGEPKIFEGVSGGGSTGGPGAPAVNSRELRMASAADEADRLPAVREALDRRSGSRGVASDTRGGGAPAGSAAKSAVTPDAPVQEPLYLIVASGDPSASRQEVVSLLSQRGLAYSRLTTPSGARGGIAGLNADAQRDRQNSESAKGAADAVAEPNQQATPREDAAGGAAEPQPANPRPANAQPARPESDNTPQPATPVPATPPASQPRQELAQANEPKSAEDGRVEEVLIVRRIPRSRAAQLVADLNRPSAAQFAIAYGLAGDRGAGGGSWDDAAGGQPADLSVSRGRRLTKQFGNPAQGDLADDKAKVAAPMLRRSAPQEPAAKPTGAPEQRAAAQDEAAPQSRPAPVANSQLALRKSEAPTAASGTKGAIAPRPVAKDAAGGAAMGGRPATTPAATATNPARPIQVNDPIELVYLDMRRNNQPVAQPMRVSVRGTIYVAGFGEFALVGMTPAEATAKLTAAVQGKSPASKGVEVRRPAQPAAAPIAGGAQQQGQQAAQQGAAGQGAAGPGAASRPAGEPGAKPSSNPSQRLTQRTPAPQSTAPAPGINTPAPAITAPAPAATAPPAPVAPPALRPEPSASQLANAPDELEAAADELVDLVIVLQREPASANP